MRNKAFAVCFLWLLSKVVLTEEEFLIRVPFTVDTSLVMGVGESIQEPMMCLLATGSVVSVYICIYNAVSAQNVYMQSPQLPNLTAPQVNMYPHYMFTHEICQACGNRAVKSVCIHVVVEFWQSRKAMRSLPT